MKIYKEPTLEIVLLKDNTVLSDSLGQNDYGNRWEWEAEA